MTTPAIKFNKVEKFFTDRSKNTDNIKSLFSNPFSQKIRQESKSVLKNISFEIMSGEFVGIMGRNGAGKSTILKLIAQVYQPNHGEVHLSGRVAPVLELGAGFSPDLSGRENIFLNASLLGYTKKSIQAHLSQIIDFSELKQDIDAPIKHYSSGMLVRLAFSIVAFLDSPILLFDEVLAVGDVGFQKKCLDKIDELFNRGKTIILVTHSPSQIVEHCSRAIVIERSGIIFDGEPAEAAKLYQELF